MSPQNPGEHPPFQVNEKIYKQLLEWQRKLQQTQLEDKAFPETRSTENPNPRGTKTNQNDH